MRTASCRAAHFAAQVASHERLCGAWLAAICVGCGASPTSPGGQGVGRRGMTRRVHFVRNAAPRVGTKKTPSPVPEPAMALTPGARLGPYEILSAIGAGGMGEVYRARDTKLDRDVAIKVLPDAVRRRSGAARAVHARGADARGAQSPEHRADLRPRGIGRIRRAGHGAGRGRGPRRSASRAGRCRSTRRCRSRGRSPTRSRPRTSRASSIAI